MKFVLGSANFGQVYGLKKHNLNKSAARKVLKAANKLGINNIDTASNYGESENILAASISTKPSVSTKVYFDSSHRHINSFDQFRAQYLNSKKLFSRNLKNIYFHNLEDAFIQDPLPVIEFIDYVKSDCKFITLGCSIYEPKDLDVVFEVFTPDTIQSTFNIFDRQIVSKGCAKQLYDAGIRLEVRSLFLQGLLASVTLLQSKKVSPKLRDHVSKFFLECQRIKCSPLQVIINVLNNEDYISSAVIGVGSEKELHEIMQVEINNEIDFNIFDRFVTSDRSLIDPRMWK
jgi:aryl-alcohol dehydrogenase-like predicted oxidoreductase